MLSALLRRAPLPKPCLRSMSTESTDNVLDILASLPPSPQRGPPKAGPGAFTKAPPTQRWERSSSPTRIARQETLLRLHCHSTPNNTIATLTKSDGSTIAWFSGGSCGFKKGNRATYEAGYQCAVRTFRKIEELAQKDGNIRVDLLLKGFGQGREALKGALLATEGERIRPLINTVTDRTAIKIGGTRAKKMPRN